MSWQSKVKSLFNSGITDIAAIQAELLAPRYRIDRTPTKAPRTAAQKEFIRLVVEGKVATREELKAQAEPGAYVYTKALARITNGTPTERSQADRDVLPILFSFVNLLRLGQTVAGDEADADGEDVIKVALPSWWEENQPGETPPSLHEIREVLREKQRREQP